MVVSPYQLVPDIFHQFPPVCNSDFFPSPGSCQTPWFPHLCWNRWRSTNTRLVCGKRLPLGLFFFCKMAVSNEFFSFPDLTTMTGASSCFKLVKGNRLEVLMPGWDWIWSSVSQIALRFFFRDFSRCLGFL